MNILGKLAYELDYINFILFLDMQKKKILEII